MESPYLLVSPALAGFVAGFGLMAPALQAASRAGPEMRGRAIVLAVLPASAPLLALVAAYLADLNQADATTPLLALGAAAALQCVVQGVLVRVRLPRLDPADAQGFGRLLIQCVLPDTLTMLAFIAAFLAIN